MSFASGREAPGSQAGRGPVSHSNAVRKWAEGLAAAIALYPRAAKFTKQHKGKS